MFQINYASWGFDNFRNNVQQTLTPLIANGYLRFRVNNAVLGNVPGVPAGITKDLKIQYEVNGVRSTLIVQCEVGGNNREVVVNTATGQIDVANSNYQHAPGFIRL